MKEEYNRLFEKVAPRMSDDELFKAVLDGGKGHSMENKNTTPKKRRIAPMIAAVAAAAALATTAGAVTSYYRNVNEDYNNILSENASGGFAQEYTDKNGNAVDQKDQAAASGLYEKLNIELNKTFEYDGFTLEIPGAICDGEDMLIMFDIIFNEGHGVAEDERLYLFGETDCDGVFHHGDSLKGLVSERDGKTVYSSYFKLVGIANCTDAFKLKFERILSSDYQGSKYNIDAEIEIPITDDLKRFNKAVDIPDAPYVKLGNWGNWDLVQIEATPLGVTFNMKTDGETPHPSIDKEYWVNIPTCVTFKDGLSLDITSALRGIGIDPENKTGIIKMNFNYPVEVDNIQSIQFTNALVNMEDGSVTTVDAPEIPVRD